MVRDLAADFEGEGVRRYVEDWFADKEAGDEVDSLKEWGREMCRRNGQEVVLALRSRIPPKDHMTLYSELSVPTLIMQGSESQGGGRAMGEYLAQLVPGSTLHIFQDRGHSPHLTAPEEFNRVLQEFFLTVA
jgi:pimeloyl-ACP methyl ester carboxylesterase